MMELNDRIPVVLVNSMSMRGDGCSMCTLAEKELDDVHTKIECSKKVCVL